MPSPSPDNKNDTTPAALPAPPAPAAPTAAPVGGVTAAQWSAGDGALQVPLAGLLADDLTLETAELPPDQWRARLDEYLASERP